MIRLVHLSDLHFGTESPPALAALERALATLEPSLVVVSGDLTQRARRREFAAARRFVDALPGEHVVVPGNHDIPLFDPVARTLWPFRRYREAFGPTRTALIEHGPVRLVAVNSVRPERHSSGRVGRGRRRHVEALARAAPPGALTVVVTHHPLGSLRGDAPPGERRRTLERWRRAGVALVLSGHEHRPFLYRSGGDDAPDDAPWLLNAGTAISRRLRHEAPNSFNVVDVPTAIDADGRLALDVSRWDLEPEADDFVRRERREVTVRTSRPSAEGDGPGARPDRAEAPSSPRAVERRPQER